MESYEPLKMQKIAFSAIDIITTSRTYDEELDGEYVED